MEDIKKIFEQHNIPMTFENLGVYSYFDSRQSDPDNDSDTKAKDTDKDESSFRALSINANITHDEQRQIDLATEQFKQSVQRVDTQILAQYVQAVQNGSYAEAQSILENAQESQQVNTLTFALLTIGVILLPVYSKQRLQTLLVLYGLHTVFSQSDSGQKALREQSEKGAKSHVKTIAKDLMGNLDDAISHEMQTPDIEAGVKDHFEELQNKHGKDLFKAIKSDQRIYEYARELILKGESRNNVIKKLQENFASVGKHRATTIAGNEANRIFTLSQYDADLQFLAQNKLTKTAYKRLISNTGTPEPICAAIIEETALHPIPFKQDFVPFGKQLVVKYTGSDGKKKTAKFTPDYEHLKGGHIHVNCKCRYELLLKRDDGTFMNTNTGKVENEFLEDLHPRDLTGKFSKKGGTFSLDLSKLNNVSKFNDFVEKSYYDGSFGHYEQETTDAVRAYQGHFYDAINLHARSNDLDQPLNVYGENTTYKKTVDNINAAANISLAKETKLYRGTEIPYHQNNEVGEIIDSRSFLSTSTDINVTGQFMGPGMKGTILVVTAKKGQNVIIPDLITYGKRGYTMSEAEVLIPTGSKMTITKISGNRVHVTLN